MQFHMVEQHVQLWSVWLHFQENGKLIMMLPVYVNVDEPAKLMNYSSSYGS